MLVRSVRRGVYLCDIAQQLGVHPKTVRRALQRGGPPRRRGGRRGSVLDPYRPVVDQFLTEGVWNAVVIRRELQAKGYPAGGTVLRDYIRPKRALRPSRATVRFEMEPGRQLQADWATQRTVVARPRGRRPSPGEHTEPLPAPSSATCRASARFHPLRSFPQPGSMPAKANWEREVVSGPPPAVLA
jgi:hypothetical protein